jgi:hypothetical protein
LGFTDGEQEQVIPQRALSTCVTDSLNRSNRLNTSSNCSRNCSAVIAPLAVPAWSTAAVLCDPSTALGVDAHAHNTAASAIPHDKPRIRHFMTKPICSKVKEQKHRPTNLQCCRRKARAAHQSALARPTLPTVSASPASPGARSALDCRLPTLYRAYCEP